MKIFFKLICLITSFACPLYSFQIDLGSDWKEGPIRQAKVPGRTFYPKDDRHAGIILTKMGTVKPENQNISWVKERLKRLDVSIPRGAREVEGIIDNPGILFGYFGHKFPGADVKPSDPNFYLCETTCFGFAGEELFLASIYTDSFDSPEHQEALDLIASIRQKE